MKILALKAEANSGKTRTLKILLQKFITESEPVYVSNKEIKQSRIVDVNSPTDVNAILKIEKGEQSYTVAIITVGDSFYDLSCAMKTIEKQCETKNLTLDLLICAMHEKNSSSYYFLDNYARINYFDFITVNKRSVKIVRKHGLKDYEKRLQSYNEEIDESCAEELYKIAMELLAK